MSQFSNVEAKLGASYRLNKNEKYVYCDFSDTPIQEDGALDSSIALVTDAGVNAVRVGDYVFNSRLEQAFAGTIPQCQMTNDGLLLQTDAADNDGIEINLGRTILPLNAAIWSKSKGAFTIGTDADFFMRAKLDIANVSGADQVMVGFSVGTYPADGSALTYTDLAAINVDLGDLMLVTRLNSGSVGDVDTTQDVADNGQVDLEVRVTSAGVVKFLIDGAVPTVDVNGFTLDDGDVVHAFILILNGAVETPTVNVLEWESGHQSARGLDSINDLTDGDRDQ